jgi:peroxiredoxin
MSPAVGETAPDFTLPDTAAGEHSLTGDTALVTVVVFTCNHCPYALAWQDRIADAARDYADRGVRFLAINSNDADRYPRDSYEAMQKRVREEDWSFPYLYDETQEVARDYGARVTPDVFLIDGNGTLRYRGAPDADYSDPSLNAAWLRTALDAVLDGATPDPAETEPIGCTIKWKP